MRVATGLFHDQSAAALSADLDHLQAIGATTLWVVLTVSWAYPSNSSGDAAVLAKYDAAIDGAAARGMTVVVQAHGMPTWITAASGHTANVWHGPDTAGERANWVACLHNFLARYDAGVISHVEIWNEPHLLEFWVQGWNVTDYTRLLHDCWVDIKATWPAIKIVGHVMARSDIGWLQQAYAWSDILYGAPTSAANHYWFDVLGVHPYCGDPTSGWDPNDISHADETTDYGTLGPNYLDFRRLRTEILSKEGFNKPLAFGEFGYATLGSGWFKVTEAQRASYVADAMALAAAEGYVDYFTIYYHWTTETPSDWATSFNFHGSSLTEAAVAAAATALSPVALPSGGVAVFDGIANPKPVVLLSFGLPTAGATTYRIGVGPGIGTASIGGTDLSDITEDVLGFHIYGTEVTELADTDPNRAEVILDNSSGDWDPDNLAGPYVSGGVSLVDLDIQVSIRFEYQDVAYPAFVGVVADIVPDDRPPLPTVTLRLVDGLAQLGRAWSAELGIPAYGDQRPGTRLGLLADEAAWPDSLRSFETGRSFLAPTVNGDYSLALMQRVVRTEFGLLYVDRSGVLTFHGRYGLSLRTRSMVTQATFTDAGGITDMQRSRSRDQLWNLWAITRQPSPPDPDSPDDTDQPVEQIAQYQPSVDTYGPLRAPAQVGELLRNDSEAHAMASWLAPRYAVTPPTRFTSVRVRGLGFGQWEDLLSLRVLDRIRCLRDYGPVSLDKEGLIRRVEVECSRDPRSPMLDFTFQTDLLPVAEDADTYRVGVGPGIGTAKIGF
jgi:hypothetical protein